MDVQSQIARNVEARGYREGWSAEQYAARQVCKLTEELDELARRIWQIRVKGNGQVVTAWELKLSTSAALAKSSFDSSYWTRAAIIDRFAAASEAADMLVVLYTLADVLGVDLNALALEKSRADVERGVR